MVLGICNFGHLHLFQDRRDAEVTLEAIDVSDGEMEFCDDQGRPYRIHYIEPPKRFFFGLLIGIGRFELILDPHSGPQPGHLASLLQRAQGLETSPAYPDLCTLEDVRLKLNTQIEG